MSEARTSNRVKAFLIKGVNLLKIKRYKIRDMANNTVGGRGVRRGQNGPWVSGRIYYAPRKMLIFSVFTPPK
jgi:hypothetical protein